MSATRGFILCPPRLKLRNARAFLARHGVQAVSYFELYLDPALTHSTAHILIPFGLTQHELGGLTNCIDGVQTTPMSMYYLALLRPEPGWVLQPEVNVDSLNNNLLVHVDAAQVVLHQGTEFKLDITYHHVLQEPEVFNYLDRGILVTSTVPTTVLTNATVLHILPGVARRDVLHLYEQLAATNVVLYVYDLSLCRELHHSSQWFFKALNYAGQIQLSP